MTTNKFWTFIVSTFCFIACNKTEADITGAPAAINLVNAVAAEEDIDLNMNFTGGDITYANGRKLSYWAWDGSSSNGLLTFGVPSNQDFPLTVTLANDSTKPVFNQTMKFNPGDVYSLFIGGKKGSVGYLLHKDTLNPISDSLTAIRFINLSKEVNSISINIAGNPVGSEVLHLDYLEITSFKLYPAKSTDFSYSFEIRDATTGDFLTSFDYYDIARFRHITLILRGLKDSWPGLEVVKVNNW